MTQADLLDNVSDLDDNEEEGGDSFPASDGAPILDRDSLARIARDRRPGPPSVATTQLASEVGSVMGAPKDAFLKSMTFYKTTVLKKDDDDAASDENNNNSAAATELDWSVTFGEADASHAYVSSKRKLWNLLNRNVKRMYVETISGCFVHSKIHEGDFLKGINGLPKKTILSLTPETVGETLDTCLNEDGFLSVTVENPEGSDILIQATIIKPRPDMKYSEMGMVVWYWGYLCIKSIARDSIFRKTVLQSTDHITSINDIDCDTLTPESFARVLDTLEHDVTITVLRRKQRTTGKFG